MLDDAALRPLIDEFLHGANDVDAEERAALFRLAWDFVGSALGGRNELYERYYLASSAAQPRAPPRLHRPQPGRPAGRPVPEGAALATRGGKAAFAG